MPVVTGIKVAATESRMVSRALAIAAMPQLHSAFLTLFVFLIKALIKSFAVIKINATAFVKNRIAGTAVTAKTAVEKSANVTMPIIRERIRPMQQYFVLFLIILLLSVSDF